MLLCPFYVLKPFWSIRPHFRTFKIQNENFISSVSDLAETSWFLTSEGSSVRSWLCSGVLQLAIRTSARAGQTSRAYLIGHCSRPPHPACVFATHTNLHESNHLIEPQKKQFEVHVSENVRDRVSRNRAGGTVDQTQMTSNNRHLIKGQISIVCWKAVVYFSHATCHLISLPLPNWCRGASDAAGGSWSVSPGSSGGLWCVTGAQVKSAVHRLSVCPWLPTCSTAAGPVGGGVYHLRTWPLVRATCWSVALPVCPPTFFHLSACLEGSASLSPLSEYPLEGFVASSSQTSLSFCLTVAHAARLSSQLSDPSIGAG